MPRPDRSDQRRAELIPVIAQAFADLGYRRATTAELAERCGLRENQLYRLWPSKKDMFLASIDYLYEYSVRTWQALLDQPDDRSPAQRILEWDARHRGETGLHRIAFAGLNETDDPDIRQALKQMYRNFHRYIIRQVRDHRQQHPNPQALSDDATTWAVIGLGMISNIMHELSLQGRHTQHRTVQAIGEYLLG